MSLQAAVAVTCEWVVGLLSCSMQMQRSWKLGDMQHGALVMSACLSTLVHAISLNSPRAWQPYTASCPTLTCFVRDCMHTVSWQCCPSNGNHNFHKAFPVCSCDVAQQAVLQALIEAEKKGETWQQLGLLPAPHHVGADGVVQVPPKWENMVLHSEAFKQHQASDTEQQMGNSKDNRIKT